MWVVAAGIFGGLLVLLLRGLQCQRDTLQDWDVFLSSWERETCDELGKRVDAQARMAAFALDRAMASRAAGLDAEAMRYLEVGGRVLERTSPDIITLLRSMSVVSRMAAAIAPVEPLGSGEFRLARLSGLVGVARVAHHFLVSTAERFRLRTYVLRRGFGIVTRFLVRTASRIRVRGLSADPHWDRVASARADLRTLSNESLRTFRALVVSLAAEQR